MIVKMITGKMRIATEKMEQELKGRGKGLEVDRMVKNSKKPLLITKLLYKDTYCSYTKETKLILQWSIV
jgi:hypothetical protein